MVMSKQASSGSSTSAPSASGSGEPGSGSSGPAALPPGGGATPLSRVPSRTADLSDVHFLTVAEVASVMRVSKMTVYRMVHGGELPAVRVGRSFRVPEQAVHDYLRAAFIEAG